MREKGGVHNNTLPYNRGASSVSLYKTAMTKHSGLVFVWLLLSFTLHCPLEHAQYCIEIERERNKCFLFYILSNNVGVRDINIMHGSWSRLTPLPFPFLHSLVLYLSDSLKDSSSTPHFDPLFHALFTLHFIPCLHTSQPFLFHPKLSVYHTLIVFNVVNLN